ncbi:MAG: hypothetical protein KIT72_17625 [Polyangiaceae bacterium]|nr:hypothetical protein [Polyangiaceae bacterium]MCW5792235.1 hypothetical protein [Polyangiaceae bacterium]
MGVWQGDAKAPSQAPERLPAEDETSGSLFPEREPDTGNSAPPPLVLAAESELRLAEAEAPAPISEEELAPLSSLDASDAPEVAPREVVVEEEEAPVSDSLPAVLLPSVITVADELEVRDTSVELADDLLTGGTAAADAALKWAGRDASIDELLAEPDPGARFDTDPDGLRPIEPLDVALIEAPPAALAPLEISLEEPSEKPPVSAPARPAEASSAVKSLGASSEVAPEEAAHEAAPREAQEASVQGAAPEAPAQEALAQETAPEAPSAPVVGGIDLMEVRGLEDLPEEAQLELAQEASLIELEAEEEVGQFEVALITAGVVHVMPAVDDLIAASAGVGEVVFTGGSLADGVALRVVAGDAGATVAVWRRGALERATADCPWVADELKQVADRLQALAGVAMGLLGERLDPELRHQVTERMQVRLLLADEALVQAGAAVPGLMIVGAGRLLVEGSGELLPGEFVLPTQIISREPAPSAVHAGPGGALVLIGEPHLAQELLVSVPPLLELLVS